MNIPGVKKFLNDLIIDYIKIANPEDEKNFNFKLDGKKKEKVKKKRNVGSENFLKKGKPIVWILPKNLDNLPIFYLFIK